MKTKDRRNWQKIVVRGLLILCAAVGLVFGGLVGLQIGNPMVFAGGGMILGIAVVQVAWTTKQADLGLQDILTRANLMLGLWKQPRPLQRMLGHYPKNSSYSAWTVPLFALLTVRPGLVIQ